MPKLTFTDLQQDDWRIMNDNGDFRFTNIDGSGHALILATNNNATFAGTVTAAVIGVDSLTFNGTEIDSSGSLEIDAAADITIDAGGGDIILSDDGTIFGTFSKSGNDLQLRSRISDGDLLLRGVDGGVTIDALKLDMSAGGAATFAGKLGIGITPVELLDIQSASGDARIRLDAPSGSDTEVKFFNAGVAQYTIGHDDATDNFVIGGANVDAPLVSVGKTGNATFAGDVTISKAATPLFKLLDTTNNISLLLGADDANTFIRSSSTANVYIQPGGSTAMTFKASGQVGIGTTAPDFELDVAGNIGMDNKLYHNGDHNTYIGFEHDNIKLRTGGVDAITVNSSQNVGIGTTGPAYKLDVDGDVQINETLIAKAGADLILQARSSQVVGINSNGARTMTLNASNNVGIGTTAPGAKLDVSSDIRTATRYLIATGTANETAAIGYWDGVNFRVESGSAKPMLITSYQGNIKLGINGGTTMTVQSSNVGIGTTSPDTKLEVRTDSGAAFSNSYFRVTAGASGAYGGTAHFEGAYNDYGNVNQPNIVGKIDMGSEVVTSTDVGGTMKFFTKATGGTYATAPIERMRIGHGGNVGIGPNALSTAGGDRLHVDGTLRVGPFFSTNDRDHIKLYPHGTDSKIISPNERFHIENLSGDIILNAGGNVGIGTTSPGIKLDVNSGGSDSVARFTSTDARARILISDNNDISYFGTYIGTTFLGPDDTPSGNTINVLSNGNVGIGTTSIDEKLQVEAGNIKIEGGATSTVRGLIIAHTGWTGNQTLLVQDTTTNRGHLYTTERALRIEAGSGGGTGTGETLDFWVNGSERMMIDTTGNVGINTTAPLAKLDVRGTLRSDQGSSGPNGTSGVGELDTLIGDAGPDNTALGTPDQWLRINISGTDYVIPAYTAP